MIDYIFEYVDYIKYSKDTMIKKFFNTLFSLLTLILAIVLSLLSLIIFVLLFVIRYIFAFIEYAGYILAGIGFIMFCVVIILIFSSSELTFMDHLSAIGSILLVMGIPIYIGTVVEFIEFLIENLPSKITDMKDILLKKSKKIYI